MKECILKQEEKQKICKKIGVKDLQKVSIGHLFLQKYDTSIQLINTSNNVLLDYLLEYRLEVEKTLKKSKKTNANWYLDELDVIDRIIKLISDEKNLQ